VADNTGLKYIYKRAGNEEKEQLFTRKCLETKTLIVHGYAYVLGPQVGKQTCPTYFSCCRAFGISCVGEFKIELNGLRCPHISCGE